LAGSLLAISLDHPHRHFFLIPSLIFFNRYFSYYALYQTTLVKAANITHILSAINPSLIDSDFLSSFKTLVIPVEDDPNENLLQYFDDSWLFLRDGLELGGGVFVHWYVDSNPWLRCV
jgi:hypothetical protein